VCFAAKGANGATHPSTGRRPVKKRRYQQETGFLPHPQPVILNHQLNHKTMHIISEPSILYFGTPVVLIGTKNENGTDNLAPMSSIFWLGWRCIIGLAAASKTTQNLMRNRQCVLNLPSVNEVAAVNRLAKTTGSNPVPEGKLLKGYRYEQDKFAAAGLTKTDAETVDAPRAVECPVQMEAVVEAVHGLAEGDADMRGKIVTFELRIQRVGYRNPGDDK